MASPAYKTARQALGELQRLVQSGGLNTLSKEEVTDLLTELQIVEHELSLKLDTAGGSATLSEPRRPVGMLSRLIDAWNRDVSNLPSGPIRRWDHEREE